MLTTSIAHQSVRASGENRRSFLRGVRLALSFDLVADAGDDAGEFFEHVLGVCAHRRGVRVGERAAGVHVELVTSLPSDVHHPRNLRLRVRSILRELQVVLARVRLSKFGHLEGGRGGGTRLGLSVRWLGFRLAAHRRRGLRRRRRGRRGSLRSPTRGRSRSLARNLRRTLEIRLHRLLRTEGRLHVPSEVLALRSGVLKRHLDAILVEPLEDVIAVVSSSGALVDCTHTSFRWCLKRSYSFPEGRL